MAKNYTPNHDLGDLVVTSVLSYLRLLRGGQLTEANLSTMLDSTLSDVCHGVKPADAVASCHIR